MKRPSYTSTDPVDSLNLGVLEGQGGGGPDGFGLTVYRSGAPIHIGAPNLVKNKCSNLLSFRVPLRLLASGKRLQGKRPLKIRAINLVTQVDTDSITPKCRPSTCGNGVIEADHETCDDGNRNDGDGCNRGCQTE